jgi:hypothetical protein
LGQKTETGQVILAFGVKPVASGSGSAKLLDLGRDRTRLVVGIFAKNTTTLILKDGSSLLMPFPVCYKTIMTILIKSSDIRGIIVC